MLEKLGMWSYPLLVGTLVIFMVLLIISTNLFIDYRKNSVILGKEIYKRYQCKFRKLKSDFTLEELREFDGLHEKTGYRILTAIDGVIFDVTKRWDLYGPDRPYCNLAGNDASRCLVNFRTNLVPEKYDHLLDLSVSDVENLEEWKRQYSESFPTVGRLLKPGKEDQKYDYSDDEENAL
ncbi:hypothetical protein MXB_1783 [Myxobolus squamalis]|nr:hypothetical protein MXB_1783 [Myxobolus squamalis]